MNKTRYYRLLLILMAALLLGATQVPMRDPTRPANVSNKLPSDHGLKLTSIFISPTRALAVINGQFVRVGQSVEGAKLIRITANRVYLSRSGHKIVLQLIPSPFTGQGNKNYK